MTARPTKILARLALVLAAAAMALSFVPFSPVEPSVVQAQDDFKSLRKEYETAKKDDAYSAMERTVDKLALCNDKEAAKYLLKELSDDQKARKAKKKGLGGGVRKKIVEALAKFTDEESVGLIGKAALDLDSKKDPTLALDQFDFFKSLALMKDVAAADTTIRGALAHKDNAFVKCAALEAIRQSGAKRFALDVIAILKEENEAWHKTWLIVPINVFACLEVIVEPGDKENAIAAVEATVNWVEKAMCKDERVGFFGSKMLGAITGEVADLFSTFYWKWWVGQMKAVGAVDKSTRPDGKRSKTVATPPVFDTAPVGKRFVFVIDVSLSMELPLKITLEEIEKRRKNRGPISDRKGGDAAGEEEKEPDAENPLRKLPWKDIGTKIALAREELSRAIKSFAGDRYFAIVTYSTEVELITGGWIQATQANCDKWAKTAKELEPTALTNIHGGLMKAMRISAKGSTAAEPSVDADCVLTGADCIVFLTDGWGSWDDFSVGKTTDKRNNVADSIGDGPYIYGEDIWPDILRHNIFRKVIIHTVGIGNHDKDLMKKLSKETGGQYTDWGFPE